MSASGPGLRIAFVGTCQVTGMAAAARRMLPEAEIVAFLAGVSQSPVAMRDQVAGFDLVVTQVADDQGGLMTPTALEGHVAGVVFLPPIVFTGFHPDMTYVHGPDGTVPAGYGPYHSQIAIGAFMLRIDIDRAIRLFNAHTVHRLGYLEAYAAARARMIAIFGRQGFSIAAVLNDFRRQRTVFMHTINHPTIALSWRMSALALAKAGLVDASVPLDADLTDDLAASIVMPVLPAIARPIGVAGGETMLRTIPEARGAPRDLPLSDFVRASFDVYRATDPAIFAMPNQVAMAERLRAVLA